MRPVARIAQSVEQGIENPRVLGSIPSSGTTFSKASQKCGALSFLVHGHCKGTTAYLLNTLSMTFLCPLSSLLYIPALIAGINITRIYQHEFWNRCLLENYPVTKVVFRRTMHDVFEHRPCNILPSGSEPSYTWL